MGNYYEVDQQMLSKAKLPSPVVEFLYFADMWVVALQEMWMETKLLKKLLNDLCTKVDAAGFTFLNE